MPGQTLYDRKQPLFKLCELLIEMRAEHIGIFNPQTFKLEEFVEILDYAHGDNELAKWEVIKNALHTLMTDDALKRGGEPRFLAVGVNEAFRPNRGTINLTKTIRLTYDRDVIKEYLNQLIARTERIMSRQEGTIARISGNSLIVQFRDKTGKIRGKDSLQAKIILLLIGDKVRTDNSVELSIQDFAVSTDNLFVDSDYVPGKEIDETVLSRILHPEEWEPRNELKIAEFQKSIQSAIRFINKKWKDLIITNDQNGERTIRIQPR